MGTLMIQPFLCRWQLRDPTWIKCIGYCLKNGLSNVDSNECLQLKMDKYLFEVHRMIYKVYKISSNNNNNKEIGKQSLEILLLTFKNHSVTTTKRKNKTHHKGSPQGTNLTLSTSIFVSTTVCQRDYFLSNITSFLYLV